MPIRDQFHDPSHTTLYQLLSTHNEVRDFVKSAELDEKMAEQLPDGAFAWPAKRLFPVDTPANTVLSSLFRDKCAAVPAEVDETLRKSREIFEVEELYKRACEETAQQKQAAFVPTSEDDYLLPKQRRLRVKTAEHVAPAEALLLRDYARLSVEDRSEAFSRLVKKASDLGVEVSPATMRMAGYTLCHAKLAQDYIEARAVSTTDPVLRGAYDKLAAAFARQPEEVADRQELLAAAETLSHLDKIAGLDKQYDRRLPDPIRTVFNTEKVAEATVDMAGTPVALSKLEAMPDTWWQDLLGAQGAQDVVGLQGEELAQVLGTLPLDLKMIVKNQVV